MTKSASGVEWKTPQAGGASGYITFGGKSDLAYEPRLEENIEKTASAFSQNVEISNSITYYLGSNLVNDTVNVNGTINLPADTAMRTVRTYFLGGYTPVVSDTENAFIPLDASDFTVTLTSGNTLNVTSISITDIRSGFESAGMGTINFEGNVTDGKDSGYLVGNVSAGITFISGQSEGNSYFLESKSEE